MYELWASGAVNTQDFVWKFVCAIYIYIYILSFIHSLP